MIHRSLAGSMERLFAYLIEMHGGTLIASSPTFFRNYLERSKPGQLKTLVHMLLGSERLKPELAEQIREKLGREPLAGGLVPALSRHVAKVAEQHGVDVRFVAPESLIALPPLTEAQ